MAYLLATLRRSARPVTLAIAAALALPLVASAQLSQNSAINPNDTWVSFDLTMQTQTSSSSLPIPTYAQTYHMELGNDVNGQVVVNLWPTGDGQFPSEAATVSVIRLAAGKITVFDQNGNPVAWTPPTSSTPAFNPAGLLGSNPGASILSRLVTSNVQQQATKTNAEVVYASPTYTLTTSNSSGPVTEERWDYVASGSVYVATQATFYLSESNTTLTVTLQFANIHWNDNSADDVARSNAGFTVVAPPSTTTSTPPTPAQGSETGCPAASSNLGGTQNVVFQYGLFSSNCSWKRMIPWLNDYFVWGNELDETNINTLSTIESQASTLETDIQSAVSAGGPAQTYRNYILIGQSQGGLVSRAAAQDFQSQYPNVKPPYVRGVLDVDVPNQGAPLADWAQVGANAAIGDLAVDLWQYVGCSSQYDNSLCYLLYTLDGGVTLIGDGLIQSSAVGELEPGSSFLNNLNGTTEKFQKAALIGHTPRPWVEVRVADSFLTAFAGLNCYPETACGERNAARIYGGIFDGVFVTWAISEFVCDQNQDPFACSLADGLLPIWTTMLQITLTWNFITTVTPQQSLAGDFSPSLDDEDGVVPAPSQNYPSTGGPTAYQYSVNPSDSHTGDTKSDRTRNVLETALAAPDPFDVPTQASCPFSSSPTTASVSGNGESGSFNQSTSSGCRWNTVSKDAWISITSASDSISSGTISYAAAANPQTIPRIGYINAGNGVAGVTFTVKQDGLCTFSLSPSGPLVIQPSGGTFSVTVSTGADCPWSAVSNTSWITITGGPSGNGGGTSSGTFTFTAASNSQDADLTGSITVMNQTLAVVIGSPSGTPGTGWVTISGSPQNQTFYMCAPQYGGCPQQIPESGTVTVTVGSFSATAAYGGTETAAQIATSLANALNGSGIVGATVSGSTIYITSTINGAATNYPLSTSYTFNSPYTSPAFTSTASGSALTGGTN